MADGGDRPPLAEDVQLQIEEDAAGSAPTSTVNVGGPSVALDELGPMVVNPDGTLSRISNWESLGEREKTVALKRIAARNKERLAAVEAASDEPEDSGAVLPVSLEAGSLVCLHSLTSPAGVLLNGRYGVTQTFTEDTGRWAVVLAPETACEPSTGKAVVQIKQLKAGNLTALSALFVLSDDKAKRSGLARVAEVETCGRPSGWSDATIDSLWTSGDLDGVCERRHLMPELSSMERSVLICVCDSTLRHAVIARGWHEDFPDKLWMVWCSLIK